MTSTPLEGAPTPAQRIRMRRLLDFLRRTWWIPAILAVLAVGGQAARLVLQPESYIGTSRMWVAGRLRMPEGAYYTEEWQNYFGTQIELMKSAKIQQRAYGRAMGTASATHAATLTDFNVSQMRKSTLFILQATGPDPRFLETYLNAVMDEYLTYKKEVRALSSDDTVASLVEQLSRQKKELDGFEEKLHQFQKENNTVVLREEGVSVGNHLTQLNLQLANLELEHELLDLMTSDHLLPPTQKFPTGVGLLDGRQGSDLALPTTSVGAEYTSAREQVELLKLRRDELGRYLRPRHPRMVKLTDDIELAEKLLATFRQQSQDELAATRDSLKMKIRSVADAVTNAEVKVLDANRRMVDFEHYKADVQRQQSLYDRLLQWVQNVDVNKNLDQETVAVLDRASAGPEKARGPLKLVLALVVGLAMGLGIVLYLERADDRIRCAGELQRQFEEKIIGQVPEVIMTKAVRRLRLVESDDDRHAFLESFRNLRSSLLFMTPSGSRPRTLLITSAAPNEGKSTVATNLARTLAFAGSRVLLIDGDLRRGGLHALMGLKDRPGLTDYLDQKSTLEAAVAATAQPNLSLIACGEPSARSGELFLHARFDTLLRGIATDFDYVLIDSAPVFATADTASLAPKTDGVLFVVRSSFTRPDTVRQALDQLYQRQAKVLGFIFNRADASSRDYLFYKYAGYSHPAAAVA